jgi:hypothetical protein
MSGVTALASTTPAVSGAWRQQNDDFAAALVDHTGMSE